MLCQLCSGLGLDAIMQLKLEPDFSTSWFTKDDFPPERVPHFKENEKLIRFSIYGPRPTSYKSQDYFVPYHRTIRDLCHASKECDLCHALLQSAAGIIRIRRAINDVQNWRGPSGEGLFLCGVGNSQGIQLMALDPGPTYALLGAVGFSVDNGKLVERPGGGITILSRTVC